jgi:hypothetical protein
VDVHRGADLKKQTPAGGGRFSTKLTRPGRD